MKVVEDVPGEVTGEGCEVFLAATSTLDAPESCSAYKNCMESTIIPCSASLINIILKIHQWLMKLSSFCLLFLLYFQIERYFQNSHGSLQVQASN